MIIKVTLLSIALVFLIFFPSLYTLFYYYKKFGEYNDEVGDKVFSVFLLSIFIEMAIAIIIGTSYIIIKSFS